MFVMATMGAIAAMCGFYVASYPLKYKVFGVKIISNRQSRVVLPLVCCVLVTQMTMALTYALSS